MCFDGIDKDETHCSSFSYLHPHSTKPRFVRLIHFFLCCCFLCHGARSDFYKLYYILYNDLHIYECSYVVHHSLVSPCHTMPFHSNTYYPQEIICTNKITNKMLLMRSTCLNELDLTVSEEIQHSNNNLVACALSMCANMASSIRLHKDYLSTF